MANANDEARAIAELARDLALRQLDQYFQASDNLDTKALGVVALDVAALGAILAGTSLFHGNWAYPAALILMSGVFGILAIEARRWSYGPKVAAFYSDATKGDASQLTVTQANVDLISELTDEKNGSIARAEGTLRWKGFWFGVALVFTILGGGVSAIIVR